MDFKVLIMGIGGIGGFISGKLIKNKISCTLLTNNEQITSVINSNGITYIENGISNNVKAIAVTKIDTLENEKFDIILLIMKANNVVEAAVKTHSLLSEDGYFVTLQNGIVEDAVCDAIGDKSKVIASIIGFGGTMLEPGIYEKTTPGEIHIGELDGQVTTRLIKLSELLSLTCETIISQNIFGAMWSKLAINCCINTIGVLTGETLGEMLKIKKVRNIFLNTYQEVIDTAIASNKKPEKIAANPYLLYRSKDSGQLKSWFKEQLLKFVGMKYRDAKSSSLQSLERGRKTEIDFLNGYVVTKANENNLKVPYNEKLVEYVKEIEAGNRSISRDNIEEFMKEMN